MFLTSHNDAHTLESLVCRVYKCERFGIAGLANADRFESNPIEAAILIISYIYANKICSTEAEAKYAELVRKYRIIFDYPEENNARGEVTNYIKELETIVNSIV